MERMPTRAAEEIYSVLMRYAEASPRYYDKEGFVYSFGVIARPPRRFRLYCLDGKRRYFVKDGDDYKLEGKSEVSKINAIIKKIIFDSKQITEMDGLTVTTHAI